MAKGTGLGMVIKPTQIQKLVMTPPISSSIEEMAANIPAKVIKVIDEDMIEIVDKKILAEDKSKPYTDNQLLSFVKSEGFGNITRTDIAQARIHLSYKPSKDRKQNN
mgnify:CR=1 FL=1|tara:strand:+ start:625 stop:945 length:321 start_codon:yes stop_codon:yes gene_type:complete